MRQKLRLFNEKIKELEEKIHVRNNPNINRWVFLTAFLIILAAALIIMQLEGWDFSQHIYVACNDVVPCLNPVNDPEMDEGIIKRICKVMPDCGRQYLQPGEVYGEPPSYRIKSYPYFVAFIILIAFLINSSVNRIKRITIKRYQNAHNIRSKNRKRD